MSDVPSDERLSLVQRRRPYLRLLSGEARHKRGIIESLGDSRSTVDRAIEELRGAGLVRRTADGAWTTSTEGELLLATAAEARETAATVAAAGDLLQHLPDDERVPTALFRDAAVDVATGPTPLAIADRVGEAIASADDIRAMSVADHDVGVKEELVEAVTGDRRVTLQQVLDASLVDELLRANDETLAEVRATSNVDMRVHEDVPFGLFLTEHDGERRTTLVIYDERSVVRGQISSSNREAYGWARELFERYRREATDLSRYCEGRLD